MRKLLLVLTVLVLSGCAGFPGTSGTLSTPETSMKQSILFCNSFAGTLQRLTMLKSGGNLSTAQIQGVSVAIGIIAPYCTSPTVRAPSIALVNALDQLLTIQLAGGL